VDAPEVRIASLTMTRHGSASKPGAAWSHHHHHSAAQPGCTAPALGTAGVQFPVLFDEFHHHALQLAQRGVKWETVRVCARVCAQNRGCCSCARRARRAICTSRDARAALDRHGCRKQDCSLWSALALRRDRAEPVAPAFLGDSAAFLCGVNAYKSAASVCDSALLL
jgi:hypothetical protein